MQRPKIDKATWKKKEKLEDEKSRPCLKTSYKLE